jgi:hypothetical protein
VRSRSCRGGVGVPEGDVPVNEGVGGGKGVGGTG